MAGPKGGPLKLLYDGSSGDPTVLAFDPGGVTGWAVISVHPDAIRKPDYPITTNVTHYAVGQFTGNEFAMVDQMLALGELFPGAAKVTERFVLMQQNSSEALLSPVRLNAAYRFALYSGLGSGRKGEKSPVGLRLWDQVASLAKTTMTDDRLEMIGYLDQSRGMPHGRDATRHAFTLLRRIKMQRSFSREVFPRLVT